MALTGYDDSSSDDEDIQRTPIGSKETTASRGLLNAANLGEHSNNKGADEAETRNNRAESETGTAVPPQVGAGLLFGLTGLAIGGPFLALLTGCGAAYAASRDEGPVGDAARASGDFAVETGTNVGEAAREANERHGILGRIKDAFACGWTRVRQFDEEHKATEKVKETASDVGRKTAEFEREHHVMENILGGIRTGVDFLLGKVKDATKETSCGASGEGRDGNKASS